LFWLGFPKMIHRVERSVQKGLQAPCAGLEGERSRGEAGRLGHRFGKRLVNLRVKGGFRLGFSCIVRA
jgi:hypothetical protein